MLNIQLTKRMRKCDSSSAGSLQDRLHRPGPEPDVVSVCRAAECPAS